MVRFLAIGHVKNVYFKDEAQIRQERELSPQVRRLSVLKMWNPYYIMLAEGSSFGINSGLPIISACKTTNFSLAMSTRKRSMRDIVSRHIPLSLPRSILSLH